jgi:preprotein translocase subunit SecB
MTNIDSGAPQGTNGAGAASPEEAPQFRVLAQYIKDLSFENPGAPASLRSGEEKPQTDVSIDVQARRGKEDEYEAEIKLNVSSKRGEEVLFIIEIVYAGVFMIKNVPEESLQPVLLIECPRMLFPFARNILANLARDGGFPPLMLDPIDFSSMYRQQLAAAQEKAQQAPAGEA